MGWFPDHIWLAQKAGKGKGKTNSSGGGKGKSKGWLPDHIWLAQKLVGGKSKGTSKGFGKGKKRWSTARCYKEKKVWIGGLPENATSKDTNKALKEHLGAVFAEIGKSGTGVATFKTEEEAATAVASFNGTEFGGFTLQIDAWEKAEK